MWKNLQLWLPLLNPTVITTDRTQLFAAASKTSSIRALTYSQFHLHSPHPTPHTHTRQTWLTQSVTAITLPPQRCPYACCQNHDD
ncbi:MAG: hypothetical protein KME27_01495 [Lyngbya sp. HA4199-MV5]|nr:hypothetical protein [Lyngbya sp. HA4199-MV5]